MGRHASGDVTCTHTLCLFNEYHIGSYATAPETVTSILIYIVDTFRLSYQSGVNDFVCPCSAVFVRYRSQLYVINHAIKVTLPLFV